MKFNYKKLPGGFARPIIPISLRVGDTHRDYSALIDSGADFNIFHSEIADLLGLEVENGKVMHVGGITQGEKQICYFHEITLIIGGYEFLTEVAFMPTLSRLGHGLLGQKGFFSLFKSVNFDYDDCDVELKIKK